MQRLGLLLGFVAVLLFTTRINIINTNRLLSDTLAFETRADHLESRRELDKALDKGKSDLYRNVNGYTNDEETVHIPNMLAKSDSLLNLTSFFEVETNEPLFLHTDRGCSLTQPLDFFEWNYDENLVEWDGQTISYSTNEDNTELVLYNLFIDGSGTEMLDNLYNLDYYTAVPMDTGTYEPLLEGQVGILVELKDSAVVRYTILNNDLEDYDWINVYDLHGNKLLSVNKDILRTTLEIEDTGVFEEVTGHLVNLNFPDINSFSGELINHKQAVLRTMFSEQRIPPQQNDFLINLSMGVGDVTLEIYGTDIFKLQVDYQRLVKE